MLLSTFFRAFLPPRSDRRPLSVIHSISVTNFIIARTYGHTYAYFWKICQMLCRNTSFAKYPVSLPPITRSTHLSLSCVSDCFTTLLVIQFPFCWHTYVCAYQLSIITAVLFRRITLLRRVAKVNKKQIRETDLYRFNIIVFWIFQKIKISVSCDRLK